MDLTPQEEMVLCIAKAARESTQSRQSSSVPPPEGNVPRVPPAFSSSATPVLGSSAPRAIIASTAAAPPEHLYPLPLSIPPGPKLRLKSPLMDSHAGTEAGDTSLPEFHVTSAGTPTPSPIFPPPLSSPNTVKRGKIQGPSGQFQEVESFVGQFEEVEHVRQSAPLPDLEASYAEAGRQINVGGSVTPKISASISHDVSIAPLNISSSLNNLTNIPGMDLIRTPSPRSRARLEADINTLLGLPATSKPSYDFTPPSPLIIMMTNMYTNDMPPLAPPLSPKPKGAGVDAIKRQLEETVKQSASPSTSLGDSERQAALRDIRTKAIKPSIFEDSTPDHLLTKRDPNAPTPNVVNTSTRKMVDGNGFELSDVEKEKKRETEQDRIQREILGAKQNQKQKEEEREMTKKVEEEVRHDVEAKDGWETTESEGSETGSGSHARDKQENVGERKDGRGSSGGQGSGSGDEKEEDEKEEDEKEEDEKEEDEKEEDEKEKEGKDGEEAKDTEESDSDSEYKEVEAKDGENSTASLGLGSGSKREESEDHDNEMPDNNQDEDQKSDNPGSGNGGGGGSNNGSDGGKGEDEGDDRKQDKDGDKGKGKGSAPPVDDKSDDESDDEDPPPPKGKKIKIEKVLLPKDITIYYERCLKDDTKGDKCVELGRSAMAAYEQMVHEYSVKILNQENIIQALKRVQVTGLAALKSQKDWADGLQRELVATQRSGGGAGGEDCDDLRERLQEKDEEIQRLKVGIAKLEAQLDNFNEGYISRDDCDKLRQSLEAEVERLKEKYGDRTGKLSYDEVEQALNNERDAIHWQIETYEMELGNLNAQLSKQRTELQRGKDKILESELYIAELTTKNESAATCERDLAAAKQKIASLETENQQLNMDLKTANGKIAQVESKRTSVADPGISSPTVFKEALEKPDETIEALTTPLKSPSAKEPDSKAALKDAVDVLDTAQKAPDANDSITSDLAQGEAPDSKSLKAELSRQEKSKQNKPSPVDETLPVLFALTRTEIALVQMVHARASVGAQDGDAAVALAAARDAVALAAALDNKLRISRDYMARAKFWLAIVLFYTGGHADFETAMKEMDALSKDLGDNALSLRFTEWMKEDRVSTPVSKVALGYRQNLIRNRKESGKVGEKLKV